MSYKIELSRFGKVLDWCINTEQLYLFLKYTELLGNGRFLRLGYLFRANLGGLLLSRVFLC